MRRQVFASAVAIASVGALVGGVGAFANFSSTTAVSTSVRTGGWSPVEYAFAPSPGDCLSAATSSAPVATSVTNAFPGEFYVKHLCIKNPNPSGASITSAVTSIIDTDNVCGALELAAEPLCGTDVDGGELDDHLTIYAEVNYTCGASVPTGLGDIDAAVVAVGDTMTWATVPATSTICVKLTYAIAAAAGNDVIDDTWGMVQDFTGAQV